MNNKGFRTTDVRALYESHPYPSAGTEALNTDIYTSVRFVFPDEDFAGKKVADVGCGTGQRMLAMAERYPRAAFLGLDLSEASLEVADSLAKRHGLTNVEFRRADITVTEIHERFDLITSMGVLHHLPQPRVGMARIASLLVPDGAAVVWLYHPLGEHERLLDRELLMLLSGGELEAGKALLQDFGLRRGVAFAREATPELEDVSQLTENMDAYLHPIVHTFSLRDGLQMATDAGFAWSAISDLATPRSRKLVDLDQVSTNQIREFCVTPQELLESATAREAYNQLDKHEKLRIHELRLRPCGFTMAAGLGDSAQLVMLDSTAIA